jgi:aminoglycoside/choline kinase family phosphotransferase
VSDADANGIEQWLNGAIVRWPEARVRAVTALKGDASARRFWRVTIGAGAATSAAQDKQIPASAIAVDLGPDDLPAYARVLKLVREPLTEPPWINVQRFLKTIGSGVPEIYAADAASRMLLVEDVGSTPIFEAAERGDAGDVYRLAIDELLLFHLEGTRRVGPECIASSVAYDERLFRYELEEFIEYGVPAVAPSVNASRIAPELDWIAAELGRLPRVFSHRDYHGHNLYLQARGDSDPSLRVIDFQDALMAPCAQDLAVLLTTRDTSRIISERIEQRLLDYYFAASLRRGAQGLEFDEFMQSYWLCVLQHALKVIGRFSKLEQQGKTGYAAFIPYALAQARRTLARLEGVPELRATLAA